MRREGDDWQGQERARRADWPGWVPAVSHRIPRFEDWAAIDGPSFITNSTLPVAAIPERVTRHRDEVCQAASSDDSQVIPVQEMAATLAAALF
jgi:hypothetical protein